MAHILVCGGAGYIGSHTSVLLAAQGHAVTIVDNLSNSSVEAVRRAEQLAGRPLTFVKLDVRDTEALQTVLNGIDAVIHFAALKSVGESCTQPLDYYENNVGGSLSLLRAMRQAKVSRLVFSSSATVYGEPESLPLTESAPTRVTNPYGRTKLIVEEIIRDLCAADEDISVALLRYFNPVGAHPSGLIGENPQGIPNNLMPYIAQVAVGRLAKLKIFGGDYPTVDGTGVRDYIHVMDLASAHVTAVNYLLENRGCVTLNLGTGKGYSVLDLVRSFEQVSGRPIPYEVVERRPGDVAAVWADPSEAERVLGWHAELDLQQMCEDAWRWQSMNPDGFVED